MNQFVFTLVGKVSLHVHCSIQSDTGKKLSNFELGIVEPSATKSSKGLVARTLTDWLTNAPVRILNEHNQEH